LGEGIPSSPGSSKMKEARERRKSSLDSNEGGERRSTDRIRKMRKKKSMAFGFYDEKRRDQIRLMR